MVFKWGNARISFRVAGPTGPAGMPVWTDAHLCANQAIWIKDNCGYDGVNAAGRVFYGDRLDYGPTTISTVVDNLVNRND